MQPTSQPPKTLDPGATGAAGAFGKLKTRFQLFLSSRAGRASLPGVSFFLMGFLFARTEIFFGACPLGLSLLCCERKHTLVTFAGVTAGAATLGLRGVVYLVVYTVALLLRLLISSPGIRFRALPESPEVFGELPALQVVTGLVVATAVSAYELTISRFSDAALLFSLSMIIGTGVLTFALTGLFSYGITVSDVFGDKHAKPRPHARYETVWMQGALVLLLFLTVFSLSEISLFGLDFGYLFAAFATLFLSRRFGALRGCAAGLLMSFGASAIYSPAFGLLGLFSGMLWPLGALYSMGLGAAAGIAWCSYIGGLSGFLSVAPELVISVLIALPLLPRLWSDAIAEEVRRDRSAAEEAVREVVDREREDAHLGRLSDAFDALSRAFSDGRRAPDPARCLALCDEIASGYCETCERRVACWDSAECPGKEALRTLSDQMATGSAIASENLPTQVLSECTRLDDLLSDLRVASANLWREERNAVRADFPAPDYALTAQLLREAANARNTEERQDFKTASALRRILADAGIRPAAVSVRGDRMKHIIVGSNALSGKQKEIASLVSAFEEVCGCRLTSPRFELGGEVITMELSTAPVFRLEVAHATRTAASSEVSGDSVSVFRSPDHFSYILLSDGMGTGQNAARCAGVCSLFLEKMLAAGNSEETSLRMLNRLVSVREGECSATVDLLRFDDCYGHATFLKSGAAASYVRRDGNLFRLRSKTVPIGLLYEVDAEKLRFDARPGDIIIMLSDGISQTSEDAPWLIEMLSRPLGANLENAANALLERAEKNGVGRDDMTVILARVSGL